MNQAPAAYPLDGIHARGYRGRTDTDHPADVAGMCPYPWCTADELLCTCPYSTVAPHPVRGCRYRRDDDQEDDP
jgi:hypothetical protein